MEEVVSERNIYVDTRVTPYNEKKGFELHFTEKIAIKNIFVRELIMRVDDANRQILENTKFLVARFPDIRYYNNNSVIYNTSYLDPDTDIVLNKANFIDPHISLEGKYILSLVKSNKEYSSLRVQILDDKGNPFITDTDTVFIDIKLAVKSV